MQRLKVSSVLRKLWKAFAQLHDTTMQYFSSEVASEGFGPFQNLNPSARKHEMYQATHLSFIQKATQSPDLQIRISFFRFKFMS